MPLDTDTLAELIHRKHDCLARLREMGEVQLRLVREGSMSELLDVLAVKQQALAHLQAVETALEPFRSQDPEARCWRSPQTRQECAARLARCAALLAEIVEKERESERELIRRRDEAARQLQGVHRAGQARGAYVSRPVPRPGQLDLLSED